MNSLPDLTILSQASLFISIGAWVIFIRNASISLWLILAALVVAITEEILSWYFAKVYGNNLHLINILTWPSLALFYGAYYRLPDFTPSFRRIVGFTGLAGLLVIGMILMTTNIHDKTRTPQVESMFMILLALLYFIHKIFYTKEFDIWRHTFFFITCGIFIYHVTAFTVFMILPYFKISVLHTIWSLKLCFYIVYNLFFAYGFYIFKQYRINL